MKEGKWFLAGYDSTTQVVTGVFCVAMLSIGFLVHIIAISVVVALVAMAGYAWSPRGYWVSGSAITVKRLIGNVVIPVEGLSEVRKAEAADLAGCIRLFGSGGLFGYYGTFQTSSLGVTKWYVTNRAHMVVGIGSKTLLFSPDDVDGFLDAVRVGRADDPPVYESSGISPSAWVGFAVAGLALALVAAVLSYSPGPPSCTIANGTIAIHDRFYPVTLRADEIDAVDARVVAVGKDSEWRPVARTNGFSNSRYSSGWFRTANGQTVRMYRAGAERLVLIPGRAGRTSVLLEAKDPDGMAASVRSLAASPVGFRWPR